ncbi:hypothetical protein ACGFX4_13680 [Kitasatospora sp. NPDC048365]|uniref:hypothetical protein n=1 Tax=Kitasatospora sp. NPDC048365 TaxID=3364050 RepID=UPI003719C2E0
MEKQWPEGRVADPEAARERYDADLRRLRDGLAIPWVGVKDAHLGLGLVLLASVLVGVFVAPAVGALVLAPFGALFLVVLAVQRLRGRRVAAAARSAYIVAFGWLALF